MLSRILLVGATGTNLPSNFVQKIKSVRGLCPHLLFRNVFGQSISLKIFLAKKFFWKYFWWQYFFSEIFLVKKSSIDSYTNSSFDSLQSLQVSNNSNRSSGGSGATPTEHTRERKTTYDSDDVSEREAEQEQAAAATAVTMPPSSAAAESGPEAANKTATLTSTFQMGSDKPPTSSWHMGSDKLVLGGSETA